MRKNKTNRVGISGHLLKIKTFFFIIFFIVILAINIHTFRHDWQPNDSFQNIFWSENIASNNFLFYKLGLNYETNQQIFGLRGTHISPEGNVPTLQIGLPILFGVYLNYTNFFPFFLMAIFSVLGLFFLFKLASLFMEEKYALMITISFSMFYVFIFNSVFIMNNMPSFSMFFASAYYFFLYVIKSSEFSNLLLSAIFLSITFWLRYPDMLLFFIFIPFVPLLLKKLKFYQFMVFISIPLLSLFIFFFTQNKMFGSFFSFISPETLRHYAAYASIANQGPFFFESWDVLFQNIKEQLWPLVGLFIVVYILVLVYSIKEKKCPLTLLLCIPLFQIFYYFGNIWGGFGQTLQSYASLQRYFIISYGLIFLAFGVFVEKIIRNRKVKMALITAALVLVIVSIPLVIKDIKLYDSNIKETVSFKSRLAKDTPENSIVFTRIEDKNVFPERTPAIYQVFNPDIRINQTICLISELLAGNYTVYFLEEDDVKLAQMNIPFREYEKALQRRGLVLKKSFGNFYEVLPE